MHYFYFYFIIGYSLFSIIGLIIDIFTSNIRINSIDINQIKSHYTNVAHNVSKNVLIHSLPVFLGCELFYLNYKDNTTFLNYIGQYIITLGIGLNLEYLIHLFKHSKYFYKYHDYHHQYKHLFGFMTYYMNYYDFILSTFILIFPAFFRFNPIIVNLWILLVLYKQIICDHCNLELIGYHYNIHHVIKIQNYSIIPLDRYYNTLNTNITTIKSNKSEDSVDSVDSINKDKSVDSSDKSVDSSDKKSYNKSCYNYLCKTLPKKEPKRLYGRLHYSNYF